MLSRSSGDGMLALPVIPALLLAVAQQPAALTIGSAIARAGQSVSGFIEVPAGVDSATRIPISIVRGMQAGPTLALIAGTHGSEVAPIVALQRVRPMIDPAALRGTVLIVHVANMPSFLGRTIYYSPIDGKNLNRVYPGKADGTVSERIAYAITNQIIERADYLVDMHAGDGNESLRPYSYWSPLGLNARAERGQSVQKGAIVGVLTDFFGNQQAEIRAPFGGIVLYVVATPAMSQGEPMGMIGEPRLER